MAFLNKRAVTSTLLGLIMALIAIAIVSTIVFTQTRSSAQQVDGINLPSILGLDDEQVAEEIAQVYGEGSGQFASELVSLFTVDTTGLFFYDKPTEETLDGNAFSRSSALQFWVSKGNAGLVLSIMDTETNVQTQIGRSSDQSLANKEVCILPEDSDDETITILLRHLYGVDVKGRSEIEALLQPHLVERSYFTGVTTTSATDVDFHFTRPGESSFRTIRLAERGYDCEFCRLLAYVFKAPSETTYICLLAIGPDTLSEDVGFSDRVDVDFDALTSSDASDAISGEGFLDQDVAATLAQKAACDVKQSEVCRS